MLQYTIEILKKVSFNAFLFKKELRKSLNWLVPHEIELLRRWLRRFVEDKPYLHDSLELIRVSDK